MKRTKMWFEKEEEFEARYRNGRHCKNLWKHIPDRLREAVDDCNTDSDGYWIYLAPGWDMDTERIIHCYTIADIKEDLERVGRTRA